MTGQSHEERSLRSSCGWRIGNVPNGDAIVAGDDEVKTSREALKRERENSSELGAPSPFPG